jgi:hypothetical protein
LKKYKPWFDKGFSKLVDPRKQGKLQRLQDPSEINGDNLNNVSCEASRYSRNKKREYLKDKINELATNSKNKNIRDLYSGINRFKRGYQPRSNLLKDENGDLLADSHNILNRWKNYFSQLMNVHNVSDVKQIEVHTAEPLVPGPSLEVEIAIPKLKKCNSPGSDEIYSKVHIGKHLYENFPIQNGLKQGDVVSPLLLNFAVEYAIRKVQESQVGLKLNRTHQLLAYADDVNSTFR